MRQRLMFCHVLSSAIAVVQANLCEGKRSDADHSSAHQRDWHMHCLDIIECDLDRPNEYERLLARTRAAVARRPVDCEGSHGARAACGRDADTVAAGSAGRARGAGLRRAQRVLTRRNSLDKPILPGRPCRPAGALTAPETESPLPAKFLPAGFFLGARSWVGLRPDCAGSCRRVVGLRTRSRLLASPEFRGPCSPFARSPLRRFRPPRAP